MKTNGIFWGVLFTGMAMIIAFSGVFALGADSKGRPEISAGERALAMMEVQNAFSKHAYYHQVGQHCEEMEDIWVKEDGTYGPTATWRTMGSVYEGIPLIREYYCTYNLNNMKKSLAELSKKIPSVKNIPENIGAGHEYVMHTQETPVIEVAGDGKTAKGIWYSIGQSVRGDVDTDGNSSVSTGWMWEKYAVDFAYEDGKWKIWHLENIMDQGPVESGGQQGAGGPPGGGGQPGAGGAPPGSGMPPQGGMSSGTGGQTGAPPMPAAGGGQQGRFVEAGERMDDARPQPSGVDEDPPVSWSPTTAPKIDPRFPEPYYTFSETFSY